MAIRAPSRPLVTRVAGVLLGAWGVALPAAAFLPCGPTNAKNWCVDESMLGFSPSADTQLGGSLAFGDFDGDGFDDLAVGAPGAVEKAGFVRVFYSNGSFLDIADSQGLSQLHGAAGNGGFEFGDRFGFALASGDFDGDGFDDLAVGSPGEGLPAIAPSDCTVPTCERAGAIHVFHGSDAGLRATEPTFLHAGDVFAGPGDGPFEDEAFGAALAAGDFGPVPDGIDDLAVGAPGHSDHPGVGQGRVYLMPGSTGGLLQGANGVALGSVGTAPPCGPFPRDFGAAIAAARFDLVEPSELVVAAPRCYLGSASETGMVFVFGPPALREAPTLRLAQSNYAQAANLSFDRFGTSLASGDFNADGIGDLAVGTPFKDHGGGRPADSGLVYVAYGAFDGSGPDPAVSPDLVGEEEWPGQTPEAGDFFGSAIAAGRVDRDPFDDLLIGTPGEGAQGGFLYLKKGSAVGLTTAGNLVVSQGYLGGDNEPGDRFGEVLAVGDVNGDGVVEVAIGVPREDVGEVRDAGMVYVTRFFDPASHLQ